MTLNNYVDQLKQNKKTIIKYWLSNKRVVEILDSYKLDKITFVKKYASFVIDYYIDVIDDKKEIGDCPVINDLLDYLKSKDLSSDELFIICSGFKIALVKNIYDLKIDSFEVISEVDYIFERNFAAVLNKYSKTVKDVENKLRKTVAIVNKYVIMSKTDKKGIIKEVSDAFCDISGFSRDELIGQSHNIVRHPDTNQYVFKNLWETILDKKVWQGEIKNQKRVDMHIGFMQLLNQVLIQREKLLVFMR